MKYAYYITHNNIIIVYNYIVGEFGIVYKGYIIVKEQGSIVTDIVAVKTLKGDRLYYYVINPWNSIVICMLQECMTEVQ